MRTCVSRVRYLDMFGGRWKPGPGLRRVAGAVAVTTAVLAVASPAEADEVDEAMVASFEVRPASASVAVALTLTVRNNVANEYLANGVRYTYLARVSTPVHRGAAGLTASAGGRALSVAVETVAESRYFDRAIVTLPAPLYNGETQEVTVAYDLPAGAPRSDSVVRVNPAYASFPAFATGDDGQARIDVTLPTSYRLDVTGFRRVTGDGARTTFTTGPTGEDGTIEVRVVAARADAFLSRTDVTIAGRDVALRSWPGDDAWAAFARDTLERGLPELQRLVGLPWPIDGTLEVRQTDTPSLRGYDGRYDSSTDVIEVDEDLDRHVMVHELAHAWFNRELFTDIWITEGLADTYAERTLAALGETDRELAKRPDPASPHAVALDRWRRPGLDDPEGEAKELWSYGASHWVMDRVVAEVGVERMAAVLGAAEADTMAYLGADTDQTTSRPAQWRRLLDLLEEVGGSTDASELFRTWVVAPEDATALPARAIARAAYRALLAESDGWAAPAALRVALEGWSFEKVDPLVADARLVLADRAALTAALQPLGLEAPARLQGTYESATGDLSAPRAALTEALASARTVAAAVARADGTQDRWTRIGLWRSNLPARRAAVLAAYTADDVAAIDVAAVDVDDALARARTAGQQRARIVATGLVGLLALPMAALLLLRRSERAFVPFVPVPAPPVGWGLDITETDREGGDTPS